MILDLIATTRNYETFLKNFLEILKRTFRNLEEIAKIEELCIDINSMYLYVRVKYNQSVEKNNIILTKYFYNSYEWLFISIHTDLCDHTGKDHTVGYVFFGGYPK